MQAERLLLQVAQRDAGGVVCNSIVPGMTWWIILGLFGLISFLSLVTLALQCLGTAPHGPLLPAYAKVACVGCEHGRAGVLGCQ